MLAGQSTILLVGRVKTLPPVECVRPFFQSNESFQSADRGSDREPHQRLEYIPAPAESVHSHKAVAFATPTWQLVDVP